MSNHFDSISEEEAAPVFALYSYCKTDVYLPYNCYDYDNVRQYGKADFACSLPGDWPHVEYKSGPLNTIRTKAASTKAEANANARRANGYGKATDRSIQLEFGYNHSVYKLAEAQAKAPPLGYITVFKNTPTLVESELYRKHGLVYCTLDSFGMFLGFIQAVKKGLPIDYTQFTCDGQEIRYNLRAIYLGQLEAHEKRDPAKCAKKLSFSMTVSRGSPLEEAPKDYKGLTITLPKPESKKGKAFYAELEKHVSE